MSMSMLWYSKLDVNTKIYIKEITPIILGEEWYSLIKILTMRQTIELIYTKLVTEGIVIPVVIARHQ